ncbi:MAG: hypothetical protein A2287_09495 [Candidatus Melainabacteria bacterium RIFOXYA12_FULL_32_12]|nr:MAG: hypothetical protein A2255_08365 [Candidatus Melainabacteria bacterium RIFOXYA2_FULL_32_9]OGI26490.1 MAG: hypothetical protein A2287_09495 [Candidatus Melainabacteria bacterium RIFOXYA12_FULL_32_12]
MKKCSITLLILAIFTLLITSNIVQAQDVAKESDRGTLSARGTATQTFPPDTATITLAVETQAKTASEAATQNATKASNVVNKIRNLINTKQGDAIQTSRYSIVPIYEYTKDQRKNILTGYRAVNQVTIRTKQLNNVSNIIDTAIASGANRVEGVNFTLSDREAYCNKVLAEATRKAQEEARVVAGVLGVTITGVKQVNSSCGEEYPRPVFRAMAGDVAEAAAMPPTPIEAGDVTVQGSVNVDFFIK